MSETKKAKRIIVCKKCRKEKKIKAKGLCGLCYALVRTVRRKNKNKFGMV
jgi:hypothetical protein